MKRVLAVVVFAASVATAATARADLMSDDEAACNHKEAGDLCAMPDGDLGACRPAGDSKHRSRTRCDLKSAKANASATPSASSSATSEPAPSTSSSTSSSSPSTSAQPSAAPQGSPDATPTASTSCNCRLQSSSQNEGLSPQIVTFAVIASAPALLRRRSSTKRRRSQSR